VVVDIRGSVGEDTIMDNHDWEIALAGGESGWLPGFDDAFVGMKAGDQKTFTLRYPAESASRYRGQEATFEAALKEVRRRVWPEINDEFARSLGDYADLADLRAKTQAQLTVQRASEAEAAFNNKAIEALIEKTTFAYPPAAVEDMLDEMVSDAEIRVSDSGYKFEDFLRLQGMTTDRYREQLRPAAERRLKSRLALNEFAEAEGIMVAPEESQAELDRMANDASDENQAQRIRDTFNTEPGLWLIGRDLRTRKALARLREIATAAASEPGTPETPIPSSAAGEEAPFPETDVVAAESNVE
jgi:trigger factor